MKKLLILLLFYFFSNFLYASDGHYLEVRSLKALPYFEIGSPDAPVVFYDFYSFTCPACGALHRDVMLSLKEEYVRTGKLRVVFYDLVTDSVGLMAGKLTRCLGAKNYERFTYFLFKDQEAWAYALDPVLELQKRAKFFGMDKEAFDRCINNKKLSKSMFEGQKALQEKIEVTHIPYGILALKGQSPIDGEKIEGLQDFKFYQTRITSLLEQI